MATESTQELIKGLNLAKKAASELIKRWGVLGEDIKKSGKDLEKAFDGLNIGDSKDIAKLSDLLNEVNAVSKQQVTINKELAATKEANAKINIKLAAAQTKENQELLKNKIRLQEANKAAKQRAKESLGLVSAYDRESRRLNELRKRYKNLAVQERANSKEAKELLKNITKLDKSLKSIDKTVGQSQRNVGNYGDALKELQSTTGVFGREIALLKGVMKSLNTVFSNATATSKTNTVATEINAGAKVTNARATQSLTAAQKAMNIATNFGTKALRLFKVALIGTGIGALLVALGSFVAFLTRSQDGIDGVSKKLAQLTAVGDVVIDRFAQIGEGISKIFSGDVTEGLDLIKTSFDGITEEIALEVELAGQLEELVIKLGRQQQLFAAESSKSVTLTKELTLIAKDKLKTDKERVAALEEINKIELDIEQKKLDLQDQELAASLDSISADKTKLQLGEDQLKFVERIKNGQISVAEAVKLSAAFTLSSAGGAEALSEITQKIVDQEQAKQSLLTKQATTVKRLSALQVQIATKNSTALLQQATLQKLIATDEREAIDNRVKALTKARDFEIKASITRLRANIINELEFQAVRERVTRKTEIEINKLLEKNTGLIIEQTKKVQDLKKERSKALTEEEIRRLSNLIDLEQKELDTLNSLATITERNIAAEKELQEIKLKRAIDDTDDVDGTFDDRISAVQERVKAEIDLIDFKTQEELKKENLTQKEREAIRERGFEEQRKIVEKGFDDIDSINDERSEEELDKLEGDLAKQEELYQKSAEVIGAIFTKLFDKRREQLDNDLDANREAQDKIQKGIEAGNEDARKSLALKEKEEAELLARQERLKQQELRVEAGIALFKAYGESGGDLGKTIADTAVLTALIQGLPSFYEGTELVSDGVRGMKVHDGKDGILAMIDKDERIVDPTNNIKFGGLSNSDAGDILQMHQRGLITDPKQAIYMTQSDNSNLEKQVAIMTESLNTLHQRIPRQTISYDAAAKEHIDRTEYGKKVEIIRTKSDSAWV